MVLKNSLKIALTMPGVRKTAAMLKMLVFFAKDQKFGHLENHTQMATSELFLIERTWQDNLLVDSKSFMTVSGELSVMTCSTTTTTELKLPVNNSDFHTQKLLNMILLVQIAPESGWITWNVLVMKILFGTVEAILGEITIAAIVRMLVSSVLENIQQLKLI